MIDATMSLQALYLMFPAARSPSTVVLVFAGFVRAPCLRAIQVTRSALGDLPNMRVYSRLNWEVLA